MKVRQHQTSVEEAHIRTGLFVSGSFGLSTPVMNARSLISDGLFLGRLIACFRSFGSRDGDDSFRGRRSNAAHGMREMTGEIGAIASLKNIAAVRRSHLYRAGHNKKHFLAFVLLPAADKFRACFKEEPLHQPAFGR